MYRDGLPACRAAVTIRSTNPARRTVSSLIKRNVLLLCQATILVGKLFFANHFLLDQTSTFFM